MPGERANLSALLAQLNGPQRDAVVGTDGPVLILAGAGSGKTRVITYRIAYLLLSGLASPRDILAVTFTNKAAGEMRERVADLFDGELAGLWICTFHAFGARLLRLHAEKLGLTNAFSIYDEDDSSRALKAAIREAGFDPKRMTPESISSWMDQRKFYCVNPELDDGGQAAIPSFLEPKFRQIFDIYQRHLRANNAVDFDDLLTLPARLFLTAPDVLDHYRRRFKFLLVDEYQDTNRAQYHLCRLLAPAADSSICVVGDEDQSIYSWRGADIRNILEFERDYPGTRTFHLMQNYRSTDAILTAAGRLIRNNSERRKTEELWTDIKGGAPIDYRRHDDGRDEAAFVARTVEDLAFSTSGYRYRDVAVFYRMHAQSRAVETEFVRRHIPYRIFGGLRFFERRETKDLLAYLRVMANPLDQISLLRIANVPTRKLGDTTLERSVKAAAERDLPLYAWLELAEGDGISGAAAKRLRELHAFLERWRDRFDALRPSDQLVDTVRDFIEDLGYVEWLNERGQSERVDLVEEFLAAVADPGTVTDLGEPDRQSERPLVRFLNQVTLATDQDRATGGDDHITLMTLHNAKGLEFPVVFLIGLDEGLLPYRSAADADNRLEEERRLCYVGFTRARERLFLSSAARRFIWGRPVTSMESRFLTEAGLVRSRSYNSSDTTDDDSGYFPDEDFSDPFWND